MLHPAQLPAQWKRLNGPLHRGRLRTRIGTRTRFINFPTLDVHRRFLTRCQPEDTKLTGFEQGVRAWGQGQRVRVPEAGAVREAAWRVDSYR